ncbi:HK97 gp10 family phage protein [Clostridium sp. AWRP]|uniref:HK97 gp10 family phage protein n=1 Tax=Clostridium sp. AWRP TaxID=2212991 RepID=UPI000FDAF681|nr:HK97 gp10 family phage protein [Clostridium sp. AWRP]AZV57928.1 HK97 gp10 family phage protein [Clostridium sp. AWRP]
MGLDIKGLDEYKDSMNKLIKGKLDEELEKQILIVANKALTEIKNKIMDTADGKGCEDLIKSLKVGNLVREGNKYYIEIFSTLDSISYVEYGHKTRLGKAPHPDTYKEHGKIAFVPGKHMFKISSEKLEKDLPEYISNWFNSKIKEYIS